MSQVFLSHAHADADAVRTLYDRLVADGVDAWFDKEKLIPGQDWEREIRKAVHEADVVIVCLSKQFNQRGYRQKEVRIALDEADMMPEGEIFIIPARLEECEILESLRKWHWVDLFEKNGYKKLMQSLHWRAQKVGAKLEPKKNPITGVFRKPIGKRQSNPEVEKQKQEATKTKDDTKPSFLEKLKTLVKNEVQKWVISILIFAFSYFAVFIVPSWFSKAKFSLQTVPTKTKEFVQTSTVRAVVTPLVTVTPSKTDVPRLTPTQNSTSTPTTTATPEFSVGSTWTRPSDDMTMVYIPEGNFLMGNNNGYPSEQPEHTVYLNAFWIDQTEVTNSQYLKCVEAGGCDAPGGIRSKAQTYPNYPVTGTWYIASNYCSWVGARLPTEAEWEKAARGGEETFVTQDDTLVTCFYVNLNERNCLTLETKTLSANGFGIYDMVGNVYEWVDDWYDADYYKSSPIENPSGPPSGDARVVRGGLSYFDHDLSVSARHPVVPYVSLYYGFRCAKDVP